MICYDMTQQTTCPQQAVTGHSEPSGPCQHGRDWHNTAKHNVHDVIWNNTANRLVLVNIADADTTQHNVHGMPWHGTKDNMQCVCWGLNEYEGSVSFETRLVNKIVCVCVCVRMYVCACVCAFAGQASCDVPGSSQAGETGGWTDERAAGTWGAPLHAVKACTCRLPCCSLPGFVPAPPLWLSADAGGMGFGCWPDMMFKSVTGWLVCRLTGWLIDWLTGWLVGWLVYWLAYWHGPEHGLWLLT